MACNHPNFIKLVSIHAPVRERQRQEAGFTHDSQVSIHAPVRERHVLKWASDLYIEFQFTLP